MAKRRIGVRTIVEFEEKHGSIDQRASSSDHTALEGTRIHKKLQRQAPKNYQKEVTLKLPLTLSTGEEIIVDGRMDGLIYDELNDQYTIDEIKTSETEFEQLEQNTLDLFWAQLKFYGYIFTKNKKIPQITLQLTYYQTLSQEISRTQQTFTAEALAAYAEPILDDYQGWLVFESKWHQNRQQAAAKLKFPFAKFRNKQRDLSASVYKTILSEQRLFVEAPTGTGKTMATLFPTVKAIGANAVDRIFYLTAKQSTRLVAEKSLTQLRAAGAQLKSITLTAKDKICFMDERICTPEHCPFADGYFDRRKDGIWDLLNHEDNLDRGTIEQYARKHTLCPFELSLDTSLFADVIICDYNYLFDPMVFLQRFFADKAEGAVFLVDEAHNLVDRSRNMYSTQINDQGLTELIRLFDALPRVTGPTKYLLNSCHRLLDEFTLLSTDLEHANQTEMIKDAAPLQLLDRIANFIERAHDWLKTQDDTPLSQAVLNYYLTALTFSRIADFYDASYRTEIRSINDTQLAVKLLCLDPQAHLDTALAKGKASILFSATLSPTTYYREVLGSPNALAYRLPSPFPPKNQRIIISSYIQTTYRTRDRNIPKIAASIHALAQGKKGNYLVFCPSYHLLEQIRADFEAQAPDIATIAQTSAMSESERQDFLTQFTAEPQQTLVGFAVLGGIFSEGIDLTGDRLIGVAVVSVGLPGLSLENNTLKDYFDIKNGRGFAYAYQLPGMNNVRQAAGRLIRQLKDRGIVLLLDQRFLTPNYQQYFPAHWQQQLTVAHNPQELAHIITDFWRD
ncbi:ATP-dependent DNA helicase [Agrilactobacillus fermenti]|uniref:ATP-dependent DNA helicase n=1 Tax=Agrilactobacillus fermenti TaxID=2586909 RepID=UPI003A5B9D75